MTPLQARQRARLRTFVRPVSATGARRAAGSQTDHRETIRQLVDIVIGGKSDSSEARRGRLALLAVELGRAFPNEPWTARLVTVTGRAIEQLEGAKRSTSTCGCRKTADDDPSSFEPPVAYRFARKAAAPKPRQARAFDESDLESFEPPVSYRLMQRPDVQARLAESAARDERAASGSRLLTEHLTNDDTDAAFAPPVAYRFAREGGRGAA